MGFVGRNDELNALDEGYNARRSSFIVIYGRKRIGKTELIKRSIEKLPSAYYLATEEDAKEQLRSISSLLGMKIGDEDLARFGAVDWESMFLRIRNARLKKKLVMVVDEFSRLAKIEKAIPSIFQKGWELYLKDANLMLILSGSSISMMRSSILNSSAPLYKRNTATLKLEPLDARNALLLAGNMQFIDALRLYFIFGGIPAYYAYVEGSRTFKDTIERIFKPGSVFLDEPSILLSEEVKNTGTYLEIISFIANGVNRPGEIASKLGIPASNAIRYMGVLEGIGLIGKSMPITSNAGRRSKGGIYIVKDNYALFWAKYIRRNIESLAMEGYEATARRVLNEFDAFASLMFERFAADFLSILNKEKMIKTSFTRIGKWWGADPDRKEDSNQEEIDVVAINEHTKDILFAECKWTNAQAGNALYYNLKRKARLAQWHNADRKEHFALFSKSGFTEEMLKLAKEENVMLFDLNAIVRMLGRTSQTA